MKRLLVVTGFLAVLAGLGVTDAFMTASINTYPTYNQIADDGTNVSPPGGVAPVVDPDVFDVLTELQMVTEQPREQGLLERIVPTGTPVTARVLLKDNDRIGYFAFVESAGVKDYFRALKDALHASFSKDVTDLLDTTDTRQGKPTRNILTFLDPSISEERVLFLRVRQRLYELHTVKGKEADAQVLVEALSQ